MNSGAAPRENEYAARLKAFGMMIKLGSDLFHAPDFETAAGMTVNSSRTLLKFKSAALAEVSGESAKIVAQYAQINVNPQAELTRQQVVLASGVDFSEKEKVQILRRSDAAALPDSAADALMQLIDNDEDEMLAVQLQPPAFLGNVDFRLVWLLHFSGSVPKFAMHSVSILMNSYASGLYSQRCCRVPVQQRLRRQFSGKRLWLGILVLIALILMFFPVRNTVNTEFVLRAPDTHSVYAWFDGPIARCYKQDGDFVKKGEVVAEYETSQLKFRIANAESQLREIEKEYEFESSAAFADRERIGKAQLIEAKMQRARVAVEEAKWYLDHAELKAPADGILVLADGRAELLTNKAVRTGDRIFDIYSGTGAVAEIQVDQQVSSVLLGKPEATLFLYTEPDRALACTITEIQQYPMLNEQRVYCYKVRADLEEEIDVRYGMRGIAKLRGDRVSLGYSLFKNLVLYLRWL